MNKSIFESCFGSALNEKNYRRFSRGKCHSLDHEENVAIFWGKEGGSRPNQLGAVTTQGQNPCYTI